MINILYCVNSNDFDGMLTTTLSILKRSEYKGPYTFYVCTRDGLSLNNENVISDNCIDYLNDIVIRFHYQNKVIKMDLTTIYNQEFGNLLNKGCYKYPYELLKLCVDMIPNMPEKLLYVNVDVLFNDDIRCIYNVDINDYEYLVCKNCGLLFNLDNIKETRLLENARNLIKDNNMKCEVEYVLNKCRGKKKVLFKKAIRGFSKGILKISYPCKRVFSLLKNNDFNDILEEVITLKQIYIGGYYE